MTGFSHLFILGRTIILHKALLGMKDGRSEDVKFLIYKGVRIGNMSRFITASYFIV